MMQWAVPVEQCDGIDSNVCECVCLLLLANVVRASLHS